MEMIMENAVLVISIGIVILILLATGVTIGTTAFIKVVKYRKNMTYDMLKRCYARFLVSYAILVPPSLAAAFITEDVPLFGSIIRGTVFYIIMSIPTIRWLKKLKNKPSEDKSQWQCTRWPVLKQHVYQINATREEFLNELTAKALSGNISVNVRNRCVYLIKQELLFGIMPANWQVPLILRFKRSGQSTEVSCAFQPQAVSVVVFVALYKIIHIIMTVGIIVVALFCELSGTIRLIVYLFLFLIITGLVISVVTRTVSSKAKRQVLNAVHSVIKALGESI